MLDSDKLIKDFDFKDDYGAIPNEIKDIIALYDAACFMFMLIPNEFNTYSSRYSKYNGIPSKLSAWELRRKPCFVISDEFTIPVGIESSYNIVITGSLEERLNIMASKENDGQSIVELALKYIIPLSKEEFESKIPKEIDYKDFINQ